MWQKLDHALSYPMLSALIANKNHVRNTDEWFNALCVGNWKWRRWGTASISLDGSSRNLDFQFLKKNDCNSSWLQTRQYCLLQTLAFRVLANTCYFTKLSERNVQLWDNALGEIEFGIVCPYITYLRNNAFLFQNRSFALFPQHCNYKPALIFF
jgi:hypothetical protein